METETRASFARRHAVQRSTVTKWEAKGLVVLTDAGLVDIAATEERLASRPQVYRGGRRKGPSGVVEGVPAPSLPSLGVQLDAFQILIREAGRIAAKSVVAAGGSMRVAHALDLMIPSQLASFAIDRLPAEVRAEVNRSDWPFEGLGYGENEPDWKALARDAGEPFDPEAWEDHLAGLQARGVA